MLTTFVILSFALHFAAFFAIILLYQRMQKLKEEGNIEQVQREIEDTLFAYTEEMKEENQKLLARLQEDKTTKNVASYRSTNEDTKDPVPPSPSFLKGDQKRAHANDLNEKSHLDKETYEYKVPHVDQQDRVEASPQAQVLALAAKGFSRDQIAQKLDMGKGEVDLFLKFYHK